MNPDDLKILELLQINHNGPRWPKITEDSYCFKLQKKISKRPKTK